MRMKIIGKNRSAKVVDRITKGFLFAFLMLGAGFTGLQAQNVQPANFYNLLNGEATNEITLDPGDTFTWTMGINSDGGMDGVTATYYFPFEQMQEDNELATDLIPQFIFPVQNIVENETGYVTFTKTAVGTFITGSQDIAQWTYTIGDDVPLGTVITIEHVTDPAVVLMSNIVYIGNELLAPEDAPGITINVGEPVLVDCPELGLNIGDACDDEDDNTENDVVGDDCSCAGTPIDLTPVNDLCENAISLECGQTISGSNVNATNDPDLGSCNSVSLTGGAGVWYTLTGFNGVVSATTCSEAGPEFDTKIGVFSGSCEEKVCVTANDDGSTEDLDCTIGTSTSVRASSVSFNASADETYYIYVVGFSATSLGGFDLTVSCEAFECPELSANIGDACDDLDPTTNGDEVTADCECAGVPAPSNDLCENALPVACGEQVSGSTVNASETGEPTTTCGTLPSAAGVWYTFTADAPSIVTLNMCGTDYDSKINVYSGPCDDRTCVGGNDDDPSPANNCEGVDTNSSFFVFEAEAGVEYTIYVNGFSTATGNYVLDVSCEEIVCFAEAGTMTADENPVVSEDGTATISATAAGDAVVPDGFLNQYVLTSGADLVIQGISETPSFDVTAYGDYTIHSVVFDADDAEAILAAIEIGVTTGGEVIALIEELGLCASLDVDGAPISVVPPAPPAPVNDLCADAIALECGNTYTGNNISATEDVDCGGSSTPGVGVWYTITVDVASTITLETCFDATDFDTDLSVFTGSCDDLTCFEGFSDDGYTDGTPAAIASCGGTFPLNFRAGGILNAEAGVTYYVLLQGYSDGDVGNFELLVSCEEVLDCPELEANIGDACNDDNDQTVDDVVGEDCVCAGTPVVVEFDCPELEANFGDACNDGDDNTANDMITENCECAGTPVVTPDCEDFVYYISDHATEDGISDIYEVTISGGVATMEYIATSDIEIHIAYNNEDNLIYAVSKHENSYRTINPHEVAPSFGPTIALGADYGELTAAVFAPNGNLLIGSQDNNAIYSVNVATNVVSSYDTYAPVTGGDLAFASNGMLYLATRSGNGLYEVYPADVIADVFIGNVPSLVTGMAITDVDQLLVSARGNMSLDLYNADGSSAATSYMLELDGEAYTLRDGDMTSGCNTFSQPGEGECLNYKLYYVHTPQGGGQEPLLEVTLNGDGTASYTTVIPNLGGHIGLSPDGSIIYNVGGSDLKIIDVATASVITTVDIISAGGADLSGIPAALVGDDGTLYIGHSGSNQVYTVNPATGIATPYGPSRTVNGGDLIEVNGEIWLITRNNNTFTNVLTGASFTVPVNEINGAAVLTNGNVLLADGNGGSLLKEVEIASQSVVATHDIALPLFNGDLAGACIESGGLNTQCYGSEILGFEQGLQTNGNAVPLDRSDATAALGQPDASNAAGGFVSLGEGGSITIGFGGVIYDAPGNDIRIWETSFSGDACGGADDEQADIELSQDGINFVSAGSICRDGEVDIAGTGLDYVAAIRITNSASTGSLDGYDVDGVEAINGCENNPVVENGDCYATEVVEYVQGTSFGGGAIAANRTNPAEALGAPERSNQSGDLVFVSLGYGGSLTLSFDGAIPNGDGDDIEVVETTWGNNSCNSYDEFANVYVSVSGEPGDWHMVKTICRADNFVDISDAGDGTLGLEYVNYVKIVNNNDLSNTPDAFDVDGVVALYNCEDGQESQGMAAESNSVLSSYPNPTSGPSQVVFMTAETGRTLVEVYDMSGRMVTTLFNAEAQQGEEYRIDFDGASLPNGVYIYKMTTTNETIIDKFMIAK